VGGRSRGGDRAGVRTAHRRERLVDPVGPEASGEWLRGHPLEKVSVGERKKSIPAELVRQRVARMLVGEWEALCQAAAPSALPGMACCPDLGGACDVISLVNRPGGGVRPVACGEALRKLAGKAVRMQMRGRVATSARGQLQRRRRNAFHTRGPSVCGISGGVEDFPELSGMIESCFRHQAMQRVAGGRSGAGRVMALSSHCFAETGLELNVKKSAIFNPTVVCGVFRDLVDAAGDPIDAWGVGPSGGHQGGRVAAEGGEEAGEPMQPGELVSVADSGVEAGRWEAG
ncbi:hypothetical protein CYMTET_6271, partial [Cymbomonas tetramitiformis]